MKGVKNKYSLSIISLIVPIVQCSSSLFQGLLAGGTPAMTSAYTTLCLCPTQYDLFTQLPPGMTPEMNTPRLLDKIKYRDVYRYRVYSVEQGCMDGVGGGGGSG